MGIESLNELELGVLGSIVGLLLTAAAFVSAASARGVKLTSRSRPLKPTDMTAFDYIIAMDMKNQRDILMAANHWASNDKKLPQLDQASHEGISRAEGKEEGCD